MQSHFTVSLVTIAQVTVSHFTLSQITVSLVTVGEVTISHFTLSQVTQTHPKKDFRKILFMK